MNTMNTSSTELPDIYLHPGEMYISDRPALVCTVLGSCISVTFFSPRLKVGAICHGLLPACKKEKACTGNCADGLRYVECSIKRMTRKFTALGILNSEIEVKVFGGADMIKCDLKNGNPETVGMQNTKIALSTLKDRELAS